MATQQRVHDGRVAFKYLDFRLFQASKFLFTLGYFMQGAALGYQVFDITGNPLTLGYVGLSLFVPAIALALPAGHLADRFDRRRIILLCQWLFIVTSLILTAFSVFGLTRIWPVYITLVIVGIARVFSGPASQALLPQLVPTEHFHNAIAWNSSIWQFSAIIGPGFGGALYAFGSHVFPGRGAALVYLTNAVLSTMALALMFFVKGRPVRLEQAPASWQTLLAGVRYVFERKILLGAISLDLFAVLLGGAVALMPVYAKNILHVGPLGNGLLRGAPAVGAAVMAVLVAHMPPFKRAGAAMFWGVTGFGVVTIIFGISKNFMLSLVMLTLLGAFDMMSVVVRQTLVQIVTPDHMRGRVSAVNSVFIGASNELGEFESGVTARWFGTVPAVVLGGLGTLAVVAIWAWRFPALRKFGRLDVVPGIEDTAAAEGDRRTT